MRRLLALVVLVGIVAQADAVAGERDSAAESVDPRSVVVADLNRDGHADVATGNFFGDSISVLLATRGGGLSRAVVYDVPVPQGWEDRGAGERDAIAAADVSGDGEVDLVTAGFGFVSVHFNDGQGRFPRAESYPLARPKGRPSEMFDVAVVDMDHDGRKDIVTAAHRTSLVFVLPGIGGGAFAPLRRYATAPWPIDIEIADVTRDGNPDVFISALGLAHDAIGVFFYQPGRPDGALGRPRRITNTYVSPVVARIDGDSDPDIIWRRAPSYVRPGSPLLYVALGRGDGTFERPRTYTAVPNASQPIVRAFALGDFNGDRRPDVVAGYEPTPLSPGRPPRSFVAVLLGRSAGRFGVFRRYVVGGRLGEAEDLATGDLNRDGHSDVVAVVAGNNVGVWLTRTDGSLRPPRTYPAGQR